MDNFDWNRARSFLATAQAGSFSAAARALGSTQPTVGRQVAALERELGVTLFERVGGRLVLTESGRALLSEVREMGKAAARVSLTAAAQSDTLQGQVSLTASEAISAFLLPPILARLRAQAPGIQLDLVVSNQARDLQRREADIAVRHFRPTQPELIAKRLPGTQAHFYAAPAYTAQVGPLSSAQDLSRAEIFAFDDPESMELAFQALGIPATKQQFPISCPNHLVQWELCKRGLGVCMMMEEVGDAEPGVSRVLQSLPSIPVPFWLVCHRELHTSPRIRLVFDLVAEGLAKGARDAASGSSWRAAARW